MKNIKILLSIFCVLLVSVAFAQNGDKADNFKTIQANKNLVQNVDVQNLNISEKVLTAEQIAIRDQRQLNTADSEDRANSPLVNQNITVPAGVQGGKITLNGTIPDATINLPNPIQLTQDQKKERIRGLLNQIKNQ